MSLFRKDPESIAVHRRAAPLLIFHTVYGPLSGSARCPRIRCFVSDLPPLLLPLLSTVPVRVNSSFFPLLTSPFLAVRCVVYGHTAVCNTRTSSPENSGNPTIGRHEPSLTATPLIEKLDAAFGSGVVQSVAKIAIICLFG